MVAAPTREDKNKDTATATGCSFMLSNRLRDRRGIGSGVGFASGMEAPAVAAADCFPFLRLLLVLPTEGAFAFCGYT